MGYRIKESLYVCVQYPADAAGLYSRCQRVQCPMLTAVWSVSIGKSIEFRFVYRRQHGDDCLLYKLVLYGSYAQGALLAISFRDIHPQYRFCTVAAFVDFFVQFWQTFFQLLFILLPCDTIYSLCSFTVQLIKALPEQFGCDMMQQGCEATGLICFGTCSHAFESK